MRLHFTFRKFSYALLAAIAVTTACKGIGGGDDPGDDPGNSTTAQTVDQIQVTAFSILPAVNDNIYSEIKFVEKSGSNYVFTGAQQIKYYKATLTALKTSFTSNAAKVTIGSTAQASGVTANNFSSPVTYRFYAANDQYKEYTITLTNPSANYSGLPIVSIAVENGADITSKTTWRNAVLKIDDPANAANNITRTITTKGRGNTTWAMAKKPYAIKFEAKEGPLGMAKAKKFALLANYGDKTLLRNLTSFEIGKRTSLAWTPDSKFVELFLNGNYLGQYQLTEQITISGKRVDITEDLGYLIELDRHTEDAEITNVFRPTLSDLPVILKDPEPASPAQLSYIEGYFNQVEALIYKEDIDSAEYCNLIDISSFIDSWIVYEATGNMESRHPGSMYMYKDINPSDKLYAGPVWDFDMTSFMGDKLFVMIDYPDPRAPENYDAQWVGQGRRNHWFVQLFNDPKIKARARERWIELYPQLQSIPTFITAQKTNTAFAKSAAMNWTLWPRTEVGRNKDENLPWDEAVDLMVTNYNKRLTAIDALIRAW